MLVLRVLDMVQRLLNRASHCDREMFSQHSYHHGDITTVALVTSQLLPW